MDPQRLVFFGGQGSRRLFASSTPNGLTKQKTPDECVEIVQTFLSTCYIAFIQETLKARANAPVPNWANFELPTHPESLLTIPTDASQNPIFQGVSLYISQLRAYLIFDPTLQRRHCSTFAGFCSGILPATVASCSATVEEFLTYSREGTRLAFWIGYRAAILRQQIAGDSWQDQPWALSVLGMEEADLKEATSNFNAQTLPNNKIDISSRFGKAAFSIAGPGEALEKFRVQHLSGSPQVVSEPVFVHALYHGGDIGIKAVEDVLQDALREGIQFPALGALQRPLWPCMNGIALDSTTSLPDSLLHYTLRLIFVDRPDLYSTWHTISESIRPPEELEVLTVGPGAHALFTNVYKGERSLPPIRLVDIPGITHSSEQRGFAIVGMSVNFPNGSSKEEFWRMLEEGLNAAHELPSTRFQIDTYQPTTNPPKDQRDTPTRQMKVRHGNFIADPFELDHEFFGISPREAKSMDPQQKMLLHGAVHALDDAGYVPNLNRSFNPQTFGCYIGCATEDYVQNLARQIDVYYSTGTLRAFLSGKISYAHGWGGPSLVLDTACSSSTAAIAMACRALANGDCSAALAGGVNAITSPDMYLGLARAHFLSPTGQCRPFDASADGYCRAEGCGLFVIKRLPDAIEDGDRIYGVIRHIEINQSGNASSITHPEGEAQVQLFRKLLTGAQLDHKSIDVIEAHGTGTQAGDAVETSSIQSFFGGGSPRRRPIYLTSIKGNIGHAEAASGSASLAKLLFMLQHSKIPPQVGLKTLNPKLQGLASNDIKIPTSIRDWSSQPHRVRRALLNNFGASGSNVALIIEELNETTQRTQAEEGSKRKAYNWIASARSIPALHALIERYCQILKTKGESLLIENLSFTTTARRQRYDHSLSLVCQSVPDLLGQLESRTITDSIQSRRGIEDCKPVVFVFSGQGSFYPGMGQELMRTSPSFRKQVLAFDEMLQGLGYTEVRPSQILEGIVDLGSLQMRVIWSQVACFVLEVSLALLLQSWNIHPTLLIGHSLGEYAAMAVAGVLSLEDAVSLVAYRATLMATRCELGKTTMLACNQSSSIMQSLLSFPEWSKLTIACVNGDSATVISGPVEDIDKLAQQLKEQGTRCKVLDVALGFHSEALDPILEDLQRCTENIRFAAPRIPLGSCAYGRLFKRNETTINASYICQQTRNPVLFDDILSCLADDTHLTSAAFVEIGPAPITLPMVRSRFTQPDSLFLPCLVANQDPWTTLCNSLRHLSLRSHPINWISVFAGTSARVIDLPAYPFQSSSLYVPFQEPWSGSIPPLKQETASRRPSSFCLLNGMVEGSENFGLVECHTNLSTLHEYIRGHSVAGNPLCPASVYHSMVLEAAHSDDNSPPPNIAVVSNITFGKPLVYTPSEQNSMIYLSIPLESVGPSGKFSFSKHRKSESGSDSNPPFCSGSISWRSPSDIEKHLVRKAAYVRKQMFHLHHSKNRTSVLHQDLIYRVIFPRVVSYSQPYQSIQELSIGGDGLEAHGHFCIPAESRQAGVLPPVFVDTLLHGPGFLANSQSRPSDAFICSQVESIAVLYSDLDLDQTFSIYCNLLDCGGGDLLGESYAITADGKVVASIEGMHFKRLNLKAFTSHLSRQTNDHQNVREKTIPVQIPAHNQLKRSLSPQGFSMNRTQSVITIIAGVCQVSTKDITAHSQLSDLGMDSLMRIELSQSLRAQFPHSSDLDAGITMALTVQDICDCVKDGQQPIGDSDTSTASTPGTPGRSPSSSAPSTPSAPSPITPCDVMTLLVDIIHTVCEVNLELLVDNTTLDSLGIDSLMSIELQQAIHSSLGIVVSGEDLLAHQSLADLSMKLESRRSQLVRDNDTSRVPNALKTSEQPLQSKTDTQWTGNQFSDHNIIRQLQSSTDKLTPLILFHDGSGIIEQYQRLGPIGGPVFGIQNLHLSDEKHWVKSLQEMAQRYANAIIASGIAKELLLGGWSFGGVLAHEVALQLEQRGYTIVGVILIDSPCPSNHQPLPEPVVDYILGQKILSARTRSTLTSHFTHCARLLGAYQPTPRPQIKFHVAMLQSSAVFDSTTLCGVQYPWLESQQARAESLDEWEALLGKALLVMSIPGNHFEPFEEDNVPVVSNRLRDIYNILLSLN